MLFMNRFILNEYKGNYFENREKKQFENEFDIFMIRENKNKEIIENN